MTITIVALTPDAPERVSKYQEHKHIAESMNNPVMILDASSAKSYKECKTFIENCQDFSSSHISLIEMATSAGYDVFLSTCYKGEQGYIHLEDWIEYLELQYDLEDYSYEEILRTGFQTWYTGFEV